MTWGWDDGWAEAWSDAGVPDGARPGRVVEEHRTRYRVATEEGVEPAAARPDATRATGLRSGGPRPAVGDWVVVSDGGPDGCLWIEAVLPRRTRFSRSAAGTESREQVVASNVDVVWIVHGLDAPLNPRRLERYLAAAWESGARPAVVLTKADLAGDPEAFRREAGAVAMGVPVRVVSDRLEGGLAELEPDLAPGVTVALLGPSGAGKSTLVNALLGRAERKVADVREGDRKGRHTTTVRHLVPLEGGALLLDTPGMRELQLWDVDEGLQRTFPDIDTLARACRFADCAHETEPGCAVKAALGDGRLDPARLESYRKLVAEAAWQARRADPLAMDEETRRIKSIMKSLRFHPKYER